MTLFVKQRVFTVGDEFHITDEAGEEKFSAVGELCSIMKKRILYDAQGREVAYIEQEPWHLLPRFTVETDTQTVTVCKNFTFFLQNFTVSPLEWTVEGEFFAHEFSISDANGRELAGVSKKWISFGDAYEISIYDEKNVNLLLAVVLVIDAVLDLSRSGAHVNVGSQNR